jgi:hypothetical protein
VLEGIVITVVGGLLLAVIVWLWKRRGRLLHWYRVQREADRTMKREDLDLALRLLREKVLEVARARDIVVPASARGVNPTTVTLSDGSKRFYFNDHTRYLQAMKTGQVPPTRSFRGKPPIPVSRWTRETLEQWLAEHAD